MEADDDRDPACLHGLDRVRPEEEQVLDVDDVGLNLVQVGLERAPCLWVPHAERRVRAEAHADPLPLAPLERRCLAGRKPTARREHERLVAELLQAARDRLRVELGAGPLLRREPVDDVEDAHYDAPPEATRRKYERATSRSTAS